MYKDIGKPWALSTPRKLYEAAKSEGIKFSECISYLNAQEDYSLHKKYKIEFSSKPHNSKPTQKNNCFWLGGFVEIIPI